MATETIPHDHDQPIGVIAPPGLFYLASRKLWFLMFARDALTIPDGVTIDIGDVLAFLSPEGVAYLGRIAAMGSASHSDGRPRSIEIGLDGEGEHLDEVQAGWEVYLGSYRYARPT